MGKAAKLKKIRRVAKALPALQRYDAALNSQLPINHNRAMKKLYNKYGINGVNGYINAVNNFVKEKS